MTDLHTDQPRGCMGLGPVRCQPGGQLQHSSSIPGVQSPDATLLLDGLADHVSKSWSELKARPPFTQGLVA